MPRQEIFNRDLPTDQMPPIMDTSAYDGDIVQVDSSIASKDYLEELEFMENPITIRLQPSSDRNAGAAFPVWVNGKGAEVFQRNRWEEIGYLPVGRTLIVKRKVLEVIARAKVDEIKTRIEDNGRDNPSNVFDRFTTPVHSFSVLEDRNPRGAAWLTEMIRRNY